MLMDIDPLPDERIVGDDNGDDFPLPEGISPGGIAPPECRSTPTQVSARDGGATS